MSKIKLSKRLEEVALCVGSNATVADIGCDHGFTTIYLIENNMAKCGIAMDINKGPLERAKIHIKEAGLEERIQTRLSDGLAGLEKGEADTILISGMGGALIKEILMAKTEVACSAKELILSPQSEIHLVRRCLHELGFFIESEKMVFDMGKYYVIIKALRDDMIGMSKMHGKSYSLSSQKYDTADYVYGKYLIDTKDKVFCEFLEKEKNRMEKVIASLKRSGMSEEEICKQNISVEYDLLRQTINKINI